MTPCRYWACCNTGLENGLILFHRGQRCYFKIIYKTISYLSNVTRASDVIELIRSVHKYSGGGMGKSGGSTIF